MTTEMNVSKEIYCYSKVNQCFLVYYFLYLVHYFSVFVLPDHPRMHSFSQILSKRNCNKLHHDLVQSIDWERPREPILMRLRTKSWIKGKRFSTVERSNWFGWQRHPIAIRCPDTCTKSGSTQVFILQILFCLNHVGRLNLFYFSQVFTYS